MKKGGFGRQSMDIVFYSRGVQIQLSAFYSKTLEKKEILK